MGSQDHAYTRAEVLADGFEARCDDSDGTRYLWHGDEGIRYEPRERIRTLITNPFALPEGPWFATGLGEKELAQKSRG